MSSGCTNTTRRPPSIAAVAVVEAVDGGVELVVRAHRLQQQPALGHLQHLDRAGREHRPARLGREGAGVARRVRQHEPAGLVHLLVVRRAAGHDPRDPSPDRGVVGAELRPRDAVPVAERRLGERADDVDLGAQVLRGRLRAAPARRAPPTSSPRR